MQTNPYIDNTKEVIQFLADSRSQQGISIHSLADSLGVYPNAIRQYLNPASNPQLDNIVRLGNALGITFSTSNTRKYDNSAEQLIDLLSKAKDYQGLSTRELAEMTGITQPSICNILNHSVMPRLNAFLLLARALGIDLEMYSE